MGLCVTNNFVIEFFLSLRKIKYSLDIYLLHLCFFTHDPWATSVCAIAILEAIILFCRWRNWGLESKVTYLSPDSWWEARLGFQSSLMLYLVLCPCKRWIRAFLDKKDLAGVEVGTGPGRGSVEKDLRVWWMFMGHKVWPPPQLPLWWSLSSQTMLTAISMSAIATNGVVPGMWLGLLGGGGAKMVGSGAWIVGRRDSAPGFGGHQDPREALFQTWGIGYDVCGVDGAAVWRGGEGGSWWRWAEQYKNSLCLRPFSPSSYFLSRDLRRGVISNMVLSAAKSTSSG